jgi:hypothetical protein
MSNIPQTDPYSVTPLCRSQINNDTSFTGGISVLDSNKTFTSKTTAANGLPSFMAIQNSENRQHDED